MDNDDNHDDDEGNEARSTKRRGEGEKKKNHTKKTYTEEVVGVRSSTVVNNVIIPGTLPCHPAPRTPAWTARGRKLAHRATWRENKD